MEKVTYGENYTKKRSRRTVNVSRMTSFLIKTGLVKDEKQANYLKIVVVVILFLYIFWSAPSLISYKFDGDLTKLPENVSSYK